MSQKYEKLKSLLKELFQLDQPDLDFGLYRIMHAKAGEVTQFLDRDLLPQVKQAFGLYQTADKAEIEKELAKVVAGVQAAGMDPDQSPKVQQLRVKLATEAVDLAALENEVYDYLYSFFRRYYSDGDFLAKRVYKPGVYAIPYEGEEVKLHSLPAASPAASSSPKNQARRATSCASVSSTDPRKWPIGPKNLAKARTNRPPKKS
jgi:adenine-specific DNA-methyltransferase